jgi:hypothetical protein
MFKPAKILILPVIIVAAFALFSYCGKGADYPSNVKSALEKAGDNRAELEKVLDYFSSWDDSLKLEAAYYLIGNMEDHCYAIFGLYDSSGNEVDFDASSYETYEEVQASFDSLESIYGVLDFKKDTLIYDLQTVKADFLINQIDYAFQAWHTRPWAMRLSFPDFLEYILPYRGSNEPLEPWREYFWEKYAALDTLFPDTTDPTVIAAFINDDIKKWFTFDPRFYYHPTDQGLAEMIKNRYGRCEDMTNLSIYAMRTVGLAVTSDYTPYWANAGGNHAWNAIVLPNGNVIPFMGAESNPGSYGLPNKMAKVYRKMYAEQKDNLAFQKNRQEKIPRWLAGKSYVDVTSSYTDICDIVINFEKAVPDSADYAYLCVFNYGEWHAVDWGKLVGNSAHFHNIGVGIAYLPAFYLNEEIVPYAPPFILHDDCTLQYLKADLTSSKGFNLESTTERELSVATDSVHKKELKAGTEYELFYWLDGWQSAGTQKAQKKGLSFNNVPQGCLYWLVANGSDKDERIFTLQDGRQVWW